MKIVMVAVVLLASLTACSGGNSSPKCSEVWISGKTLPKNYEGCSGDQFKDIPGKCDDGSKYFGVHTSKTEMFALPGGTIVAENDDSTHNYDEFYKKCSPGIQGIQ